MGRLTNTSREVIAERAVENAFSAREEAHRKAEDGLARRAFDEVVPVAEQKLARKLPENWLRRDACLRFNVGGQDIKLCVEGEGLPVPYAPKGGGSGGYNCHRLGVIPPGELCDLIQNHAMAGEKLKSERREAYRITLSMLNAISTTTKLDEVWPQGKAFYQDYADAPAPSLPAVRVSEVNVALGLAA